jgi:hypothetical protein
LRLEPLLISLLYAIAAAAFIGVLNARGVWRTVTASLLALFCLGAAVFHTARYRAFEQAAAELPPPVVASPAQALDEAYDPASNGGSDADLRDLAVQVRALRDSISAEDPTNARALSDSAYQAFENRTQAYLARARQLRESASGISASPPPGLDEAAEFLFQSLQPVVSAARDLNRYFHAENKEEERRLLESFRQSAQAADTPLSQAESRLGGPAPDSGF